MRTRSHRSGLLLVTLLIGMGLTLGPAWSDATPNPPPPAPEKPTLPDGKTKGKKSRQSQQDFLDGYRQAYNLVQEGRYEDAITTLRALHEDDHPDVANYIGYASRKLGRYDDAKEWYERALRADPKHVRTWQYYGLWHLEQGNRLKAEEHLATIHAICGTTCKEYASLLEALNGNIVY
ncbi:MAG: tetratricopeptide repeat protein [Variibacter sp.]|nr:tetratricopeptide repeat protein [Variibacter sp.]